MLADSQRAGAGYIVAMTDTKAAPVMSTTDALLRPAIYAEGVLGAPRAEDAEVAE